MNPSVLPTAFSNCGGLRLSYTLRRPPAFFPEWRLHHFLKRKAEQGVNIHVIVYKEVRCFIDTTLLQNH